MMADNKDQLRFVRSRCVSSLGLRARAIDGRKLIVEFSSHEIKQYDISHLLNKSMFSPLQERSFFNSFNIEPGGYGLVWNDEIDISEYELWKNGVTISSNV
jgi:hypothetical protein